MDVSTSVMDESGGGPLQTKKHMEQIPISSIVYLVMSNAQ